MDINNLYKDFDTIFNLGFDLNISWNKFFSISYQELEVVTIEYNSDHSLSFEKICRYTCELFFRWYNENIKLINTYESDPSDDYLYYILSDKLLGNVTKQFYRNINIDKLLD